MNLNKKFLVIPVILLFALILIRLATSEIKSGENEVFVSGTIEITKVDLSFKIGGRVSKKLVKEGERVEKGSSIAFLEDQEIMQEVSLRQADLNGQEAYLLELTRGYLPEEKAQAKARLTSAESEFSRLEGEFARQKELFEGEVISQKEFEAAKSAFEVARSKLKEAKEQYQLMKKGTRQEKIDQATAKVQAARESLNLAKSKLSQTLIKAPLMGFVISENAEAGEVVSPGASIVTIGDLENVWLRAYVSETDLGRVKLGQKVKVTVDAYPSKFFNGKVTFISQAAEFTPKNVQTEKERVKQVYRVKISIDNTHHELKAGMPAEGLIQLGS